MKGLFLPKYVHYLNIYINICSCSSIRRAHWLRFYPPVFFACPIGRVEVNLLRLDELWRWKSTVAQCRNVSVLLWKLNLSLQKSWGCSNFKDKKMKKYKVFFFTSKWKCAGKLELWNSSQYLGWVQDTRFGKNVYLWWKSN